MTPGTYLRLRREAAGLTRDDVALVTETVPPVSAFARAELLLLLEEDRAPVSADAVETLADVIRFDRHVLYQLVAIFAGAQIEPPQVCRACGCSGLDACVDQQAGVACGWVDEARTLCTACFDRQACAAPARAASGRLTLVPAARRTAA